MANWLRIVFLGWIGLISMPVHAVSTAASSFYVDWSGAKHNNTAQAHGWLTVYAHEGSKFSSTAEDAWLLLEDVVDFSITISGASSGNGTFGLADFDSFIWSTQATSEWPLNLSYEVVGQATTGGYWGSNHGSDAAGGDFNLFANLALNLSAPNSNGAAFQIATYGGAGDVLNLTSFRPVPLPAAFWLFAPALLGVFRVGFKRQALLA